MTSSLFIGVVIVAVIQVIVLAWLIYTIESQLTYVYSELLKVEQRLVWRMEGLRTLVLRRQNSHKTWSNTDGSTD